MDQPFDYKALLLSFKENPRLSSRKVPATLGIKNSNGALIGFDLTVAALPYLAKYSAQFDPNDSKQPDEFMNDLTFEMEMKGIEANEDDLASLVAWSITSVETYV